MAGFLLAFLALALTGSLLAASLRLDSPVSFLLAAYVAAWAELVALTELLSLVGWIGRAGYAAGEALVLAAAVALWLRRGRPRPRLPARPRFAFRHAPVLILAGAFALALVYEVLIGFGTPPNTFDSMHYHLSRAAAWYQQGSLGYWPAHTPIENSYPQNAEIGVLWTFAFVGRDTVASVGQLAAQVALVVSVYGIARRVGYARAASAFAALLLPTLTIVALESVTTQNDLVVASFVAAAAYFLLRPDNTALLGAAAGLAVGTKLTALFALPALALLWLVAAPRRRAALAASVAGVALLGSYAFVQNLAETGRVLGDPTGTSSIQPRRTLAGTASTVARTTFDLIDLSGWHPKTAVLKPISSAGAHAFDALHIPPDPPESTAFFPFSFAVNAAVSEDSSNLGPLGLPLLALAVGFAFAWALRKMDRVRGALALGFPLYIVALALGTRWNFYVGRFLITAAALSLPLTATLWRVRALPWLALPFALVTLAVAHAFNLSKPTGAERSPQVWRLSRVEVQTLREPELRPALEAIAERVPGDARLGFRLREQDWDYPLFGERLGRRLVAVKSLRDARTRWVVLGRGIHESAPGWCEERFVRWTLAHRCRIG